VVYDFKTMENVLLVTSDVLQRVYNDGKQMKRILSKHYTDKWIGFIWLLIVYNNGSFCKRQCGEISWSADQLLLIVKAHDQRCQLATHRLCQSL